jgi:hypothetical protein
LFADERVVVLESAAEAGKEAVALIETARQTCRRARCSSSCTPVVGVPRRCPVN